MNYLSHLYLSGTNTEVAVGNFIGDGVKGPIAEHWSDGVTVGLQLHRFIDMFADDHPVSGELKVFLYPYFSKYAGVVLDMVYDHFLALRWSRYSEESIQKFTEGHFERFEAHLDVFPAKSLRLYQGMRAGNWLVNYATIEGMDRAFNGIAQRARFESGMEKGAEVLLKHYEQLEDGFHNYFPKVVRASEIERERLWKTLLAQ